MLLSASYVILWLAQHTWDYVVEVSLCHLHLMGCRPDMHINNTVGRSVLRMHACHTPASRAGQYAHCTAISSILCQIFMPEHVHCAVCEAQADGAG